MTMLSACTPGGGSGGSNSATTGRTSTTNAGSESTSQPASDRGGSGVTRWPGTPVAKTAIPVGDGKVSTSPKIGYEDSCTLSFRQGGARASLPWIDASAGTWNMTEKPTVSGANSWPQAHHSFVLQGSKRVITTDDLPESATDLLHPAITGNFPISASDPAYQYDKNPNRVVAQSFSWRVPANPTAASSPSCTPLGPLGVATNGVVLFNALDAAGRDAGAHEIQDACSGHPQGQDIYHYHDFSPCLETAANSAPGSSTLIGYALDGYGIYLERDAQGNLPTDADLDACHGRTSTVLWDGKLVSMYHYDVTLEYPYFVGCFHGTPVRSGSNRG